MGSFCTGIFKFFFLYTVSLAGGICSTNNVDGPTRLWDGVPTVPPSGHAEKGDLRSAAWHGPETIGIYTSSLTLRESVRQPHPGGVQACSRRRQPTRQVVPVPSSSRAAATSHRPRPVTSPLARLSFSRLVRCLLVPMCFVPQVSRLKPRAK